MFRSLARFAYKTPPSRVPAVEFPVPTNMSTPHPNSYMNLANADTLSLEDPGLLGGSSFIDGTFIPVRNRRDVVVTNPANNGIVRRVTEATPADIDRALQSAESAFETWRDTDVVIRSQTLRAWHALLLEHKADLAQLITLENGKPLQEACAEVDYAASFLDWYALAARRGEGSRATEVRANSLNIVTREAVGVCVAITPWNFPLAMLARKVAPAVAAGCAVIAKPSERTPLSALAFAELSRRARLVDGVFNVLVCERGQEIVQQVLAHRAVRMVSFTGSTKVGKVIGKLAAERVLKCSLELGGHAPFIVFDDCDVEAAVDGLMKCKFRVSGQTCIAANRVFVQRGDSYEKFVSMLSHRMGGLVMGNGLDEGVTLGPLISSAAVDRVARQVEEAVDAGAVLALGGRNVDKLRNGVSAASADCFYPATLLLDVTDDMDVAREETFGPVVAILAFDEEGEVVRRANEGTEMGLAAYVYSTNVGRVMRMGRALRFGMVAVNEVAISDAATAFGGMKESGVGREGGTDGLEAYTECKFMRLCSGTRKVLQHNGLSSE